MGDNSLYLVFFILALVYAILSIFALIRTFKLHRFSPEWHHTKFFYVTVISMTLLRTVTFLIIFAQQVDSLSSFFLLLSIPDSVFIITFLMLAWQMTSVFGFAHIDDILRGGRKVFSKLVIVIIATICGWTLLQTGIYIGYIFQKVGSDDVGNELGIVNLALPTLVLGTMLQKHIKYAGSPAKSNSWKSKLRKVNLVTIFWSLGRYFRGILSLLSAFTDYSMSREIVDNNTQIEITHLALLIAYLLFCEVICFFLVLDYSFIMIFLFSEEEANEEVFELRTDSSSSDVRDSLTEEMQSRRFTVVSESPTVNMADITVRQTYRARRFGLGSLSLGLLNDHEVIIRTITFPRISGYVIEEFEQEMHSLKLLSIPNLLPYHAASVHLPDITIVTPYMSIGSLYDMLHASSPRLSMEQKLNICLLVAKCMEAVYQMGRKHGHLTSHNVLLDENMTPYVADLGLLKLKKYAGILAGYANKSAWSSPELLLENCATAMRVHESDDVYSFGVIMWETITEQEPFPGISRQRLIQMVSKESLRPEVPQNVNARLADLIKSCWNTVSARRPTFDVLVSALEHFTRGVDSY